MEEIFWELPCIDMYVLGTHVTPANVTVTKNGKKTR